MRKGMTLTEFLVSMGIALLLVTLALGVLGIGTRATRTVYEKAMILQEGRALMDYMCNFLENAEMFDVEWTPPPAGDSYPAGTDLDPETVDSVYGNLGSQGPDYNSNPDDWWPSTSENPPYKTKFEDLNHSGDIDLPIERYLRTVTFLVVQNVDYNEPGAPGHSDDELRTRKVAALGITFAHTWKKKSFQVNYPTVAYNPGGNYVYQPLRTESYDFVLYVRKTRLFFDPDAERFAPTPVAPDAPEPQRSEDVCLEVPLSHHVVDVNFILYDSNGRVIAPDPVTGYFTSSQLASVSEVEVRLVLALPEVLEVLRKTRSSTTGMIFDNATILANDLDPKVYGRYDYMGLTPYSDLFDPSKFVILTRRVRLRTKR